MQIGKKKVIFFYNELLLANVIDGVCLFEAIPT